MYWCHVLWLHRRRRKDVCGGLQLRGATEWMNPEHLFSSGVVSVADRAPRPPGSSAIGRNPGLGLVEFSSRGWGSTGEADQPQWS